MNVKNTLNTNFDSFTYSTSATSFTCTTNSTCSPTKILRQTKSTLFYLPNSVFLLLYSVPHFTFHEMSFHVFTTKSPLFYLPNSVFLLLCSVPRFTFHEMSFHVFTTKTLRPLRTTKNFHLCISFDFMNFRLYGLVSLLRTTKSPLFYLPNSVFLLLNSFLRFTKYRFTPESIGITKYPFSSFFTFKTKMI